MKWTPRHDLELVREMLAERPFDFPKGSREIAWCCVEKFELSGIAINCWKQSLSEICERNSLHRGLMLSQQNLTMAWKLTLLTFSRIGKPINAAIEKEAKVQNTANEKAKAEDVRQKALETFSETKKRKNKANEQPEKASNSKRSASAVQFLQDKAEKEMALKKEELELRRKEVELKEEQLRLQNQQEDDMMKALFQLIKKDSNV